MSAATEPRWYSVNNMGMATRCADKADAEDVARTCDIDFPRQSPHRAVQLVEVSELEAERAARIEAQQRLADMQELAAKAGLAHRKAEPVAWMWRVADSDWQLESTCPPERPLAIVEPLYTGYMADAYIGAREEVEIWKRRALEAEKKLQAEIARLTAENEAVQDAVSDAVAAEREACAVVCETLWNKGTPGHAKDCAQSIRARVTP